MDMYKTCATIPGGDYIDTVLPDGSPRCSVCPVPNGEILLENLDANEMDKWFSFLALVVGIVLARIAPGYGFRYKRFITR